MAACARGLGNARPLTALALRPKNYRKLSVLVSNAENKCRYRIKDMSGSGHPTLLVVHTKVTYSPFSRVCRRINMSDTEYIF